MPAQDGRSDGAPEYQIVFGGWLNSKSAIRKNGVEVCSSLLKINPILFESYWVNIENGLISCGKGEPGIVPLMEWRDPNPGHVCKFVGIGSWDQPINIESVTVIKPVPLIRDVPTNGSTTSPTSIPSPLRDFLDSSVLVDCALVAASSFVQQAHLPVLYASFDSTWRDILLSVAASSADTGTGTGTNANSSTSTGAVLRIPLELFCPEEQENAAMWKKMLQLCYSPKWEEGEKKLLADLPETVASHVHPPHFPDLVDSSGSSGPFSDLVWRSENEDGSHYPKIYHVHRIILAAASKPLCWNFAREFEESTKTELAFHQSTPLSLHCLRNWIYFGEAIAYSPQSDSRVSLVDVAMVSLECADRYVIPAWKALVTKHLLSCHLDSADLLRLYHVAFRSQVPLLRAGLESRLSSELPRCAKQDLRSLCFLSASALASLLNRDECGCAIETMTQVEKMLAEVVFQWIAPPVKYGIAPRTESDVLAVASALRWWLLSPQNKADLSISWERLTARHRCCPAPGGVGGGSSSEFEITSESDVTQEELQVRTVSLAAQSVLLPLLQGNKQRPEYGGQSMLGMESNGNVERDDYDNTEPPPLSLQLVEGIAARPHRLHVGPYRPRRRGGSAVHIPRLAGDPWKGIFYYLATNGGSRVWRNPHRLGLLKVSASSPTDNRVTRPHSLVDINEFPSTSYAGGSDHAWWKIEVLESVLLQPTAYSLRLDRGDVRLRHWRVEALKPHKAESDVDAWSVLRSHKDVTCFLDHPTTVGFFHLATPFPVRVLRWIVDAPLDAGSTSLHIAGIELYGYVLPSKTVPK
jgi:hypothetical protein